MPGSEADPSQCRHGRVSAPRSGTRRRGACWNPEGDVPTPAIHLGDCEREIAPLTISALGVHQNEHTRAPLDQIDGWFWSWNENHPNSGLRMRPAPPAQARTSTDRPVRMKRPALEQESDPWITLLIRFLTLSMRALKYLRG